ncbi:TPA: endolytic transglycosylase MltG [Candidatus Taylorbacteria bacterium]|nr:endolytic transglycosylase MltG [Candidatus Taylorbacteria bacterium]
MEPTQPIPDASGLRRNFVRILILVILLCAGFLAYLNDPPSTFPTGTVFEVKSGETLNSIAKDLKSQHVVRSTTLLKAMVVFLGGEQKLRAGDYYFGRSLSAYTIASRLVRGNFDLASFKVTIPEGSSMRQIATILSPKLTKFSSADFLRFSSEKEGYLFPDTYFLMPTATSGEVLGVLQENFDEKIKIVEPAIVAFGKSTKDVVTMASILEEEAQTPADWSIISGILWKRIKIGMPLQVDSTLGYVTGKASSELTTTDLKSDGPYNTYTRKGLPPTPICNPGLETITAAATPTTTPYLYYLSDKNGVIHYAATFADHIKNREKYLK